MKVKKKSKLFAWQEKAKLGGVCENCHHKVYTLTVDHIIPVSILLPLDRTGEICAEDEDNLQMLCRACNQFKGNNLDIKNPKTKTLLIKYANNL